MVKMLILGDAFCVPHVISQCKKKGIYTILTDNRRPEISTSKSLADEYWMIDVSNVDLLEQKCRETGINGIFSIPHDLCGDTAVELSERLGLPYYTNRNTRSFERSKVKFKEMCKECGLTVATDYAELLNDPNRIPLPVIVKPIDSAANKGQSICYSSGEIEPAVEYAKSFSDSKKIIVEKYIQGDEVFAVYVMKDGDIALSLFCGVFVNEGEPKQCYSITCNRSKYLDLYLTTVNDKVIDMLRKMGCKNGTVFVSSIVSNNVFYFLEMGHRLSGEMIDIGYRRISGLDYTQIYINYGLGIQFNFPITPCTQESEKIACSYILWGRDGIVHHMSGQEELCKDDFEVYSYRKVGDKVGSTSLTTGAVFLVCFSADDDEDMRRKIEKINQLLICEDKNGHDMLIRFKNFNKLFER